MKNLWMLFSIFPVVAFCVFGDDDIFDVEEQEEELFLMSDQEIEDPQSNEFDYEGIILFNVGKQDKIEEPLLSWEMEDVASATVSSPSPIERKKEKKSTKKPSQEQLPKESKQLLPRPKVVQAEPSQKGTLGEKNAKKNLTREETLTRKKPSS